MKPEMKRHAVFGVAALATAALMYGPLRALFASKLMRDYHTLIPFIPLISFYLLYLKRKDILEKVRYAFAPGLAIALAGLAFYALGSSLGKDLDKNDSATLVTSAALVFLWGSFIFAYGLEAFSTALFPHLFLLFMIPIPAAIMEGIISFLQRGSTEFANVMFWLSQVPYLREGFIFHLTGISVEVAPECSGIRSGYALFITACLAGYLFLDSGWRRLVLILCVFPITMFKNGIRIVTLTLLGTYVDPRILQSSLHREGGIPFFLVALALMAPILYFLRRQEGKAKK